MSEVNVGYKVQALKSGYPITSYAGVIVHAGDSDTGDAMDYKAGTTDGSGYVLEIDNPMGTQEMANAIYAGLKLRGAKYYPFDAEGAIADPALEVGDSITIGGITSNIVNVGYNHNSLMASKLSAPYDAEVDHDFKYEPKLERQFKREAKYARTRITQNKDAIALEAVKRTQADAELSDEMTAAITVQADRITAEVTRATSAEGTLSGRITTNAENIEARVTKTGASGDSSFSWNLTSTKWELKSNDSTVFKVTSSGAEVTGKITATSGEIGGCSIVEGSLQVPAANITGRLSVGQVYDKTVISSSTVTEYYLSTSSSSATGGTGWSSTMPQWESGKYIWTRTHTSTTYADNTTNDSYSPGTGGQYDENLTAALSTSSDAEATADGAVEEYATIYHAAQAGETITKPDPLYWVTRSTQSYQYWSTLRPEYPQPDSTYGSYKVVWRATQTKRRDGTITWTDPKIDTTTTTIDGANIITGSITANKISVSDLHALDATIGGWTINEKNIEKNVAGSYYVRLSAPTSPSGNTAAIGVRDLANDRWMFYARYDGYMYARNASIEGKITATSGTIGGVTIENGTLTGIGTGNLDSTCGTGVGWGNTFGAATQGAGTRLSGTMFFTAISVSDNLIFGNYACMWKQINGIWALCRTAT